MIPVATISSFLLGFQSSHPNGWSRRSNDVCPTSSTRNVSQVRASADQPNRSVGWGLNTAVIAVREHTEFMARLTQVDLNELNQSFEQDSPLDLLRWVKEIFGERAAMLSAMQRAGCAVCHMIGHARLEIPILFVDTGVNFQETLDTRDRVARDYGLDVITLSPLKSMEEQTKELGILYLTPEGQKQCCSLRKIEPLLQAKGRFDCLVGSLRRAEGGRRSTIPIVSIDVEMNCLRVNPLANFTDFELETYLAENDVIVNPLHAQGYTTIGCNRCTTPVLPTEPKRAGRWRHLGSWSAYCEINPSDRAGCLVKSVDLSDDLVDRLLGRKTDFAI